MLTRCSAAAAAAAAPPAHHGDDLTARNGTDVPANAPGVLGEQLGQRSCPLPRIWGAEWPLSAESKMQLRSVVPLRGVVPLCSGEPRPKGAPASAQHRRACAVAPHRMRRLSGCVSGRLGESGLGVCGSVGKRAIVAPVRVARVCAIDNTRLAS